MGKEDPELFTEDKEEIRFITSAIRNDLKDGDNKLASYMTRIMPSITSQSTSSSQQTILSIATPRLKEGLISYYDSQAGLRHRRDHFLLRQRLTVLGDVLKLQIESHSSVAVRFLTSIFDRHFGEHDILFSESIGLTGIESENLLFKKRMDIHQKAFASKQKLRLNVLSKLSLHSKDDSDSDSDSSSSSSQDNEQQQIQNKKGKSKLKQSPLKYRSSQQNITSPINKSTQIGGSKKNNKKTRTS
ncbi:MAG: hypothetical protein EZS28_000308 [Streblomastix strix]|uniref:Uncharacterized protein n=1 Tax=Streblomastix strix TaxID=222440 RepID=A0A5J4XA27_9EUKA|nr:MAG: hypothetical protein EZS28_000308 [Streblomastix strix]